MTDPNDLPPVGATVTDADGEVYQFIPNAVGVARWVFDGVSRFVAEITSQPILTALWRMQQERDQLKARVAELEGTLVGIRDTQLREWTDITTPEHFVAWAKNRAQHVLGGG